TAHGLLTWAVATLLTAALLTSTIASIVGAGASTIASAGKATATVAAATAATGAAAGATDTTGEGARAAPDYYLDMLVRSAVARRSTNAPTEASPSAAASNELPANAAPVPDDAVTTQNARTPVPLPEVARIIGNGVKNGALPEDDLHYLGRLVAQRTGLP